MDIATIRRLAIDALTEFGLAAAAPDWETPLVVDGSLRGYRFEFDGVRAFWFLQSRTLEIYSTEWRQLRVIETGRPAPLARIA